MRIAKELQEKYSQTQKKSQFLHSPDHLLADELSTKLGEPKRFGMYLKIAIRHDHQMLRKVLGDVMESKAKKPGALFAFLLKKQVAEAKESNKPQTNNESKTNP